MGAYLKQPVAPGATRIRSLQGRAEGRATKAAAGDTTQHGSARKLDRDQIDASVLV